MNKYQEFYEETALGKLGKTAQCWFLYTELVHRFMRFTRTNDMKLFIHSLDEMCSLIFAIFRPNYSKWVVKYVLTLIDARPCFRERLANGVLSIRRTTKHFSRTEVDLTIEQTINPDAASRLTGISAFGHKDGEKKEVDAYKINTK